MRVHHTTTRSEDWPLRQPQAWGQSCPNPACSHSRRMNRGNLSAMALSMTQSGQRRVCGWSTCACPCSETCATVFFDLRTPDEKVMMALKRRRVKVARADLRCVLGVTAATVLAWRRRAAQTAHASHVPWRHDLPGTPGQREARGTCIRRPPAQQAEPDGASPALRADGRQGVWSRCAPALRRRLAACVGPRTFDRAWQLRQRTAAGVLGVPGFCREGCSGALSARLAVSQTLQTLPRTGQPGRPTQPVTAPPPALVDGQGIKTKQQGRLTDRVSRGRGGATRWEDRGLSLRTRLLARLTLPRRHA
jgi:hypothetical protein